MADISNIPDIDRIEEECTILCLEYLERCKAEGLSVIDFCACVADARMSRVVSRGGREGVIELFDHALNRTREMSKGAT